MIKNKIYIVQKEVRASSSYYPLGTKILDTTNLIFCNNLEVAWKTIEDQYSVLIKNDYTCKEITKIVISDRVDDNYVYIRSHSHLIESDLEIVYRIVSRTVYLNH